MLALRLPEREVQSLLKGSLSLAAINAPASCVVSGTIDAIGSLQRELAARDIVGTILRTSHAFHSSMMEPILGPFTQIVEKVELHPPRLPFISNVTGKWITGREAVDAAYWATHLRRAVRFADGIAEMMKNPERLFLEVGPGQTLANLARQQPAKESRTIIVSSLPRTADAGSDVETILGALGRLWLSGTDIDWNAFYSQENRRRVALPTYPFERTRYWVEPAGAANGAHTQAEADRVSDKPADHAAFVASTAVNGSNGANGDNAPQTRKDRIAKELRDLLAELSGLSLSDMSEETTFTEVGFESLFLTQASLAIEKKFGVRIAFRQLLEDANCLKGLAGYVESQLPAENPPSSAHSVDRADKVTAPVTMVPAKRPASAGGSFNRLQSRPVRIQPLEVSLDKLREDLQRREQQVKQSIRVQDLRAYAGLEQGLNDLCSAYICECLSHAGIRIEAGGCCTKAQMRKTLELKPAYERFLNYMLTVLEEDQMLRKDERGVHWLRSIDELPHAPSLHDRLLSEFAEFRGIVEMLAHCAGHYRRVLAGEIPGVSVLLPGGRHDFLKQHLQNYADHYKSVKRYEALAKELVEELSAERPLCILEVGAGGGDLTWPLVPKLSGRGCEYHFTDISRTFVQAAQMEAKKQGLDFMRFGVLDISKDPASQGYEPGCFDIVLGLNVVHATARVVESLRHLKSLLVPGGLLCLVELTKYPRWDNMIIGVVEGWWLHDDAFRTDSPLMDLNSWERAFESAGLANAFALPANHDERKATDAGLVLAQRVEAPPDGLKAARSQSDVSNQKPRDVATVPLTSAQREIWFASQMSDAASCSYNECRLVDLRGALHTQALQSALQQLVARHEALRTTFAPDGAIQRVYSSANIEVPIIDLSKHAEDEAPRVLDAAQRSEASRPFDLVNGPLFRTQLFRFSQEHHVLALTVHHIICDGHSFGVVLGELAADYSAILRGGESALPGPLQFSDYARQQTLREADDTKAQEFWSNQFAGGAPVLHLPTDQPRPPVWTFDGSRAVRRLPSSLAAELKRVSSLHRCTLFTTLLASWAVLLQRLTGQSEVVVGVPIADRSYEGGSTVVGHCTNLLPLRIAVRDEDRFTDHLSRLQKLFLDAQEHQNLTFGQLFQKLNLRRETDRMPLVSATLNVERRVEELKMSGLAARVTTNPHTFSNVDLGLNVSECNGTLQLECRYNNHLFVPETIQRWLRHFQTLIESVLTNPQQAMGELAVLTAEEYRRMVEEWNNTHLDCPAGLCIHEAFEAQVERTPDAVAAVFNDESLTYRQLNDRADRIAKHLKALDVGPDVRVGICVERSIAMLAGLLGILKAGGAYVPLDPSYPRERLTFMLQDSGAPVLLTQERHMADAAVAIPGLKSLCVEAVNGDVARTPARGRATQSDNLAYVIYTSGSTGKPKGVAVTHRNVANFFAAMDQVLGAERGVWLAVTSISFDISVLELFWTLARGFTVTIQAEEKREAVSANGKWRSVAENILRHNVTHMQCTPSLAGALALAPESFEAMRRLSTLLLGGETLPPSLADRLRPVVPRLLNMYGPTEATVWSTTHRLNAPETNIPIGRPVANTQVFILDKRLKPVPIGVPGELFIGGAGVARGYLNRPELTSEKFLEDLVPPGMTERVRVYRTGDLARWRDDGTIQLLGRSDQQVKIRGHRIEPGEIELTLRLHPSVRDCAVIAHDANDSTQLAAFVACHTDAPKPDAKELRRFLEAKVPDYMIPSTFTLLDTLPRTPNGKMDRRALPSPENTRSGACETFARPGTPTEEALVQIWCGILGLKEAGVQDNFFELGGHSLLMTKVIARIRDAFQVEITMRQFFERPTIAGLGAAIEEQLAREIDQLSDEEAQRLVCATP
jgi:amino acid adenylation domain-containing protein